MQLKQRLFLEDQQRGYFDPLDRAKSQAYGVGFNSLYLNLEGREKEGLVNAWAVGADGSLSLINSVPCGGITPCHCQLLRPPAGERGQTLLLVANYGDEASGAPGLVSVFPILPSGELSPAAASRTVLEAAAGAASPEDAPRQLAPHPHMVTTDPDGDTVYLIDLGVNAILGYRLSRDPIELSHEPVVKCVLHGGAGPRHLVSRHNIAGIWVAFSPSGLHSSQDASDICADRSSTQQHPLLSP